MPEPSLAWTDPRIIAALIAGGASLLLGLVNFAVTRRAQNELRASQENLRKHAVDLEKLKAKLAEDASEKDARLAYEYEARLRLFNACGPVMFQLSTASERALGRIKSFAFSTKAGNIGADTNWLDRHRHGYYWASSFYRLLVPAAIAEILKRRLTHLDISLDGHLYAQYELALAWADCFSRDFDLARAEPELPYSPHGCTEEERARNPQQFWQQGIPRGILENAAALLVQGEGETARVIPYNAFEAAVLSDAESPLRSAVMRIAYLLDDFSPATRPVLWRVLCSQYAIAAALLEMRDQGRTLADVHRSLDQIPLTTLDWVSPEEPDSAAEQKLKEDMQIGIRFAQKRIERIMERLQSLMPQEARTGKS
jgi:hypothetical protein